MFEIRAEVSLKIFETETLTIGAVRKKRPHKIAKNWPPSSLSALA